MSKHTSLVLAVGLALFAATGVANATVIVGSVTNTAITGSSTITIPDGAADYLLPGTATVGTGTIFSNKFWAGGGYGRGPLNGSPLDVIATSGGPTINYPGSNTTNSYGATTDTYGGGNYFSLKLNASTTPQTIHLIFAGEAIQGYGNTNPNLTVNGSPVTSNWTIVDIGGPGINLAGMQFHEYDFTLSTDQPAGEVATVNLSQSGALAAMGFVAGFATPEPATMGLLALGGMALLRRRCRR